MLFLRYYDNKRSAEKKEHKTIEAADKVVAVVYCSRVEDLMVEYNLIRLCKLLNVPLSPCYLRLWNLLRRKHRKH